MSSNAILLSHDATVHVMYIDILKQNLRSSAIKMDMGNQFIFQQDNPPKHTARKAKEWLLYNTQSSCTPQPYPRNRNPIENLRIYLDVQIRKRKIKSNSELKAAILEEWEQIPPQTTEKFVKSITNRIKIVINAEGYPTK